MKAKMKAAEEEESKVVTLGPTDGQGDLGYDPDLAEQFLYERLALKEQQKLNQVGLAIIRNIDTYHLRETDKSPRDWRKEGLRSTGAAGRGFPKGAVPVS